MTISPTVLSANIEVAVYPCHRTGGVKVISIQLLECQISRPEAEEDSEKDKRLLAYEKPLFVTSSPPTPPPAKHSEV
jgi:hypothetical protein